MAVNPTPVVGPDMETALKTAVETLQASVAALDGRVTTAEGAIDTAESAITALDGRVTTLEGA